MQQAILAAAALLFVAGLGACGDGKKPAAARVVRGFEFEIQVDPSNLMPKAATPVLVASDGNPATNPPGTVQLYTPNDTLTWGQVDEAGVFGFDVELGNFHAETLCGVHVAVTAFEPADGRYFLADDRGTEYAAGVTGVGVFAYGDVESGGAATRRWRIVLEEKGAFKIRGQVLADDEACGATLPPDAP